MLPNCVVNLSTAFGQLVNPKRVRKDKLLKQKVQMRTGDLICRSIKSSIIQKVIKFSKICLISRVILIRGIAQFALGTLDCVWLGATVRRKSLNELIRRYPGFNFSDSDSAA